MALEAEEEEGFEAGGAGAAAAGRGTAGAGGLAGGAWSNGGGSEDEGGGENQEIADGIAAGPYTRPHLSSTLAVFVTEAP